MKTYFEAKKEELLSKAFKDFKRDRMSRNLPKFSYDDLVDFVNAGDYGLIAYKWHINEYGLEAASGKLAVEIFRFLVQKTKGKEATGDVKKLGRKLFEVVEQ
jgi:hypothetical protein